MPNRNQVYSQLLDELKSIIASHGTSRKMAPQEPEEGDHDGETDIDGNESGEHEEPDGDEECPTCGGQTLQDGTCPSCG